jgi:O-antigen/teichoic acid export membrane protein
MLSLIMYSLAPVVALLMNEPRAELVIQVLAITPVLMGLANPSIIYFRKNLNFHVEFVYRISDTTVNLIVAIGIALIHQSVWALVGGILAGRFTSTIVSYLLDDYRPSLEFDKSAAFEMFGFGKWVWASALVSFLTTIIDDMFIGWYLSAASLGFYQMAFRLSNAPATEIAHVISKVTFPAYSKLQNNKIALRRSFLKTLQLTYYVTLPISVGIFLVSENFITIVLGGEWEEIVPVIKILVIAGFLRAIVVTGGSLFLGFGVPEWGLRMNALRLITILITILP